MSTLKRYLTLLQTEPEPGTAAHICWIALMSDAFDVPRPWSGIANTHSLRREREERGGMD